MAQIRTPLFRMRQRPRPKSPPPPGYVPGYVTSTIKKTIAPSSIPHFNRDNIVRYTITASINLHESRKTVVKLMAKYNLHPAEECIFKSSEGSVVWNSPGEINLTTLQQINWKGWNSIDKFRIEMTYSYSVDHIIKQEYLVLTKLELEIYLKSRYVNIYFPERTREKMIHFYIIFNDIKLKYPKLVCDIVNYHWKYNRVNILDIIYKDKEGLKLKNYCRMGNMFLVILTCITQLETNIVRNYEDLFIDACTCIPSALVPAHTYKIKTIINLLDAKCQTNNPNSIYHKLYDTLILNLCHRSTQFVYYIKSKACFQSVLTAYMEQKKVISEHTQVYLYKLKLKWRVPEKIPPSYTPTGIGTETKAIEKDRTETKAIEKEQLNEVKDEATEIADYSSESESVESTEEDAKANSKVPVETVAKIANSTYSSDSDSESLLMIGLDYDGAEKGYGIEEEYYLDMLSKFTEGNRGLIQQSGQVYKDIVKNLHTIRELQFKVSEDKKRMKQLYEMFLNKKV